MGVFELHKKKVHKMSVRPCEPKLNTYSVNQLID